MRNGWSLGHIKRSRNVFPKMSALEVKFFGFREDSFHVVLGSENLYDSATFEFLPGEDQSRREGVVYMYWRR